MDSHEALLHAICAHDGEYDKNNLPAVLHPIEVARKCKHLHPEIMPVAYLHDVLEDTCYPKGRFDTLTLPQSDGLVRLTRRRGELYRDYIERVCGASISCYVKLADLHTNLNRLPIPGEDKAIAAAREVKYLGARNRIWAALGSKWWPSD